MRGAKVEAQGLFSYISPEQRVPQDHPLRAIRGIVDRSLAVLDSPFSAIYSVVGRLSIPLGADKGYDRPGVVQDLRDRNVIPHVARKRKGSAIDGHTTRHARYAMSLHVRRRIESIFGWMKTVGGMRNTRFRGVDRVGLLRKIE